MPTEAPPANPNLRSSGASPIQLSAIAGKSPADVYAENAGAPPKPDAEPGGNDFGADLRAAQAKDKGSSALQRPEAAPAEDAGDSATPATQSAPKVPSLPEPVDELEAYRQSMPPNGKSAKNWDRLKQKQAEERAALQAKIEALESQNKASQSTVNPEFETLRKERDEMKAILRDVAIERDPGFKQKYDTQTKVAIDAAKMAAGDAGEKLGKLLAYPNSPWRDEQIQKLTEDLSPSAKRRVEAALINLEQIDLNKSQEIETARQTFNDKQSAIMTQQKEREAYRTREMQSVFEGIQKQWTERHPFFQKKEGDEKYNAEVAQSVELAKQIFMGEQSAQELAQAAFWAASGERVLKGYLKVMKDLEAANETIEKLRGVEPGDGRADHVDGEHPPEPVSSDPASGMRRFGRGLQEAQRMDAMRKRGAR
jgi:hypothetical protein